MSDDWVGRQDNNRQQSPGAIRMQEIAWLFVPVQTVFVLRIYRLIGQGRETGRNLQNRCLSIIPEQFEKILNIALAK